MLSVIIPSCNEIFLQKTIQDILDKSTGDIEVLPILDGYTPPSEEIIYDSRVRYIYVPNQKGMRNSINTGVAASKGEYILKCDAHMLFGEAFDEILQGDMEDNWVVIPPRYSLDAENWCIEQNRKPRRDYHYLCFPRVGKDHDDGLHGVEWWERCRERSDPKYTIDETMSMQGSCWFMKKTWFTDFLGGMDEERYGTFSQEPQELGLKTWLGGGKLMVNKKTYAAHLHKGKKYGRMYHIGQSDIIKGHNFSAWYWMTNQWEDRMHDMRWFIERFWPVPTWEECWHTDWEGSFEAWKKAYLEKHPQ